MPKKKTTTSEVSLVWRTDLHIADKAPRSRVDDWTETLLGKLSQVGKIAGEVGAKAVIDGGDMFHIKSPWKNSHQLVQKLIDVHRTYPCPTFANIGNHDCVYGDYEYLDQQPLGVLFQAGAINPLYDQHEAWFHGTNLSVRVVGIPYHGAEYDLERFKQIKRGDEDFLVVVAHVLASPGRGGKGAMFGGEDIIGYEFLKTLDADVFCFGHWHKDQGIIEITPGKWVVNTGSMTRGALSQDELTREPCCVVLHFDKTDGVVCERRLLKVQPAEEIFDLEAKARVEEREFVLDTFIESLQETLKASKGKTLADAIRDSSAPSEVKERALSYVEQVG